MRLCSLMVFILRCWSNLINIDSINSTLIDWTSIIVTLIKSPKLSHVIRVVVVILTYLCKVDDITSFWTTCWIPIVFERYLILCHVDSSGIITSVWLSSVSLTAQLLFVMKTGVRQSVKWTSILLDILRLLHQSLRSRITCKSLNTTWSTSLVCLFSTSLHMV